MLVDESDLGVQPKVLFYLEHELRLMPGPQRKVAVVSKRMLYVLIDADGQKHHLHFAPYLDWRPLKADEPDAARILAHPHCRWISRKLEESVELYAIEQVVPQHIKSVQAQRLKRLDKERRMVNSRLLKEITHWSRRSEELRLAEQEGKPAARMHSAEARKQANELRARLDTRLESIEARKRISAARPVLRGALLVVPQGLLDLLSGKQPVEVATQPADTEISAARAREIILSVERGFGHEVEDVEHRKLGYDIESRDPESGRLRFIEVKARASGAQDITVTRNEVIFSLNNPGDYILGIVEFFADETYRVHYVREPFSQAPEFGVTSSKYSMKHLISQAHQPRARYA